MRRSGKAFCCGVLRAGGWQRCTLRSLLCSYVIGFLVRLGSGVDSPGESLAPSPVGADVGDVLEHCIPS